MTLVARLSRDEEPLSSLAERKREMKNVVPHKTGSAATMATIGRQSSARRLYENKALHEQKSACGGYCESHPRVTHVLPLARESEKHL